MLRKEVLCNYPIQYLQDELHGILTGNFIVMAAHTGVGKSTISRLITNSAIYQGCPVVLYSLEDEPQAYISDFVYREFIKDKGYNIDFAQFLIDDTLHPENYIQYKKKCMEYTKRKTADGIPLLTVHEMETSPAWTLERVLAKMKEEIARGNKLFIIDHLDVLVPSERPSDMVNTVRQLWDLVAQEQIALITFSQLATNRNKDSLCAGIDDLRGSKAKVQTPTIVVSLARHNYGYYVLPGEDKTAKPTYMRILKNRLGGNTSAALCYFDRGHYIDFYQKVDCNESGTTIDGHTMSELVKYQNQRGGML